MKHLNVFALATAVLAILVALPASASPIKTNPSSASLLPAHQHPTSASPDDASKMQYPEPSPGAMLFAGFALIGASVCFKQR